MEELKHSLLLTTLELETTLISAKEEITRRDYELNQLKDVLSRTMKDRDEAQGRCQKLMLEKFMLLQQLQQKDQQQVEQQQPQQQQQETASLSGVSSSEDNDSKSADDSNRSIISSPRLDSVIPEDHQALKLAANRPLPEKGKLLQAVKDAGPLLQNLMLAGPLPQWQHPPPQLTSIDIPPVAISSPLLIKQDSFNNLNACLSKKRGTPESYEGSDYSCPNTKYQKRQISMN